VADNRASQSLKRTIANVWSKRNIPESFRTDNIIKEVLMLKTIRIIATKEDE